MSDYPDEIELELTGMAQGGAGVGRYEGGVIFANGGLPGELVRVHLTERKKTYARGDVVEVLTPSPDRIPPRLPEADHMPWQHIAYPAQLRFKRAILREQLAKLAGINDAPVEEMLPASYPWGYRNNAQLHVQEGRIGYYAAGSHRVVDLDVDPLLMPVLNAALSSFRTVLPAADGCVERLMLRGSATYGYAIAGLAGAGSLSDLAARWRERIPALAGIAVETRQRRGIELIRAGETPVTLHEELDGMIFSLGPESFFQANTAQAEVMLQVVREALDLQPGERLLDAYSGVGTFALPLSKGLREVVAVEENASAVTDGERSAAYNGITNVRFIAAPVERALPELEPPFDAVVLDPPRRGCHPEAMAALIALAPARIAYISCHPGILARDLRPLIAAGYKLERIKPVDFFPQTPHIECLALLRHE